jgi:hypothetical protein
VVVGTRALHASGCGVCVEDGRQCASPGGGWEWKV